VEFKMGEWKAGKTGNMEKVRRLINE